MNGLLAGRSMGAPLERSLFDGMGLDGGLPVRAQRRKTSGGSRNPIVFHDYEGYIAKFRQNREKTTDDTYTPQDVWEAVVKWVGEVVDLRGKELLRPFYPGGDYENAEYPADGVVIDNPPFSMFTRICRFYSERGIPFFIFGPGLTIMTCCKWCTAVVVGNSVEFTNKAKIKVNFASNLFGDVVAMAAPRLGDLIAACPSQRPKAQLPRYEYPDELLSAGDLQTIANNGVDFAVRRGECVMVRKLDCHPKGGLFGEHLLISQAKAKAKAKAQAKAKAKAKPAIQVRLSERERRIVGRLGVPGQ